MSTKESAAIYIKNTTDGTAVVRLFHKNSPATYGMQSGEWTAKPGQTTGPLWCIFRSDSTVSTCWICGPSTSR